MQFNKVIGQNEVKNRLVRTVTENRISHAQLFSGPTGSGKLSTAIAYAQYISCPNKTAEDSCGECPSCIKFQKLEHPDLHFAFPIVKSEKIKLCADVLPKFRETVLNNPYLSLDQWHQHLDIGNKQSTISVDESLEIIKRLSLKSFESDYKFMIIWMPEKLHHASIPKLLKTLEEPTDKTLIILVTESYESLLQTILSRTQLVKFNKINSENVVTFLENRNIDSRKANDVAVAADGNISKAIDLAESTEIDENATLFQNWMRYCYGNKMNELMSWIDGLAKIGREKQKQFLNYSLHQIHQCLLISLQLEQAVNLTQKEKSFAAKFAPLINSENSAKIADLLSTACFHVERNGNPRIILLDTSLKFSRFLKM